MPDNAFDVAIVGAGLSGSLLAIQLLRNLPATSSLALIGTAGEIGTGLAYGTRNPVHVLNVRAARMSIDPDDENDFVSWLAAHHPELAAPEGLAETYAPRATYGEYVRERLAEAVRESRGRVQTSLFTGEVIGLEREGEEHVLELATGDAITARHVGLCLGNAAGRLPLPADRIEPTARPRLIEDPWHDRRMAQIAPDDRVLFVGTGLTMVDQVMALHQAGHRGAMIAVSRHGLVPTAHRAVPSAPVAWQPPADNGRLGVLFRALVNAARAAEEGGGDWQAITDGIRPMSQRLWQRLNPASRRRFFRHAEAWWSVHRHRMAPVIGEKIAALRADRSLEIQAGRIERIVSSVGGLAAFIRRRGRDGADRVEVDWVINCTGPGRHGSSSPAIVADMIARGLARRDGLGLGLDMSRQSEIIGRGRRVTERVYALGPTGRGRFLEITAVREIRGQAVEVAKRIAVAKRAELFPRGAARRTAPAGQWVRGIVE